MNIPKINIADRDKFAAGFGLVSDVLMYYPKGVAFPVFVDDCMEYVRMTTNDKGYKLSIPTPFGTETFIGECTLDSFAFALDKSKEIASRHLVGNTEDTEMLLPVSA